MMRHSEKELEWVYKALANHRRLLILKTLKHIKEGSVGDIAGEIKLSFNATSKHLSILAHAGILARDQRSLLAFYSLAPGMSSVARHAVSIL